MRFFNGGAKPLHGKGERLSGHIGRSLMSLLLCLCMVVTVLCNFGGALSPALAAKEGVVVTDGVTREADPSTMDTYIDMLNFTQNSRYAGRLWTDKTVFAYGQNYTGNGYDSSRFFGNNILNLTSSLDGVNGQIPLNADFLHVFSALGSSQKVDTHIPLDFILSLDITASMLSNGGGDTARRTFWKNTIDSEHTDWFVCDLKSTLNAANDLMEQIWEYSKDTRISVVVYWGTAYQMIPFVNGDVKFTGYSTRLDSHNAVEPVLHYTISNSSDDTDGEYVYDPVSGAHYRYSGDHKCPDDDVNQKNNSKTYEDGLYLVPGKGAVDVVSGDSVYNAREDQIASIKPDSPSQLGAGTDVEAGIYTAMKALAELGDQEGTTYHLSDGRSGYRIPAVVILGDGATNHLLVKKDDSDSNRTAGDNEKPSADSGYDEPKLIIGGSWWNVSEPQKSAGAGVADRDQGLNANQSDGAAVANFTGALQGAYWKEAIKKIYNVSETKNVKVYTVGVRADPAVLNPGQAEDGFNQNQIPKSAFETWKKSSSSTELLEIEAHANPDDLVKYDSSNADPFALARPDKTTYYFKKLENDNEDKYGIKTADLNLNYPTKYFKTGEKVDESIADVLGDVFQEIIGSVFSPLSGSNDLGVDNAVTYKDPIGKYMEIKDVKNMVLFGHNYGLKKTAMYNYSFVSNHRTEGQEGTFQIGWYHFDSSGKWYGDDSKKYPDWKDALENDNCYKDGKKSTPEDTWDTLSDGSYWAYFVDSKTAMQFIPTIVSDETVTQLESDPKTKAQAEKFKNTTYTIYRIDKDGDSSLDSAARNALHMNPAYGTKVPDDISYKEDGSHLNTPGVYALSDLRIWVEDTGEYSDSAGETIIDTNYDQALFINVPANMLPLRTVSIIEEGSGKRSYRTNLPNDSSSVQPDSAESASFPFRVFYEVGMAEDVLTSDRSIDIGKISAEYLQNNKMQKPSWADSRGLEVNDVEFFSNWYNPENRYSDYVTTGTDFTYGDPIVTFSPSTDNRYYVFQKPLPLYSSAYVYTNSQWEQVTIKEQSTNKGNAFYTPGDFGGVVIADALNVSGGGDISSQITNALGDKSPKEGDIVFLEKDLLTDVTKPTSPGENDPFSSEDYYFMAIDYYNLEEDGKATEVQYAVTRKGSEFGSAYKAAGIKNGDMLCWHDMSNNNYSDQEYKSFNESGDTSRGKPSTDRFPGGNWVVAAKPGGLRVGALAQAVGEKYGHNEDGSIDTAFTDYEKEYVDERFPDSTIETVNSKKQWGYYKGNTTRTANNYYMPTISSSSNAEEQDMVVNVYLGNNGRLWTNDTLLLVTKMLESPNKVLSTEEQEKEFNFQVTIKGFTGEKSAVRVRWNEAQSAWQRQLHYIDMELGEKLCLQNPDGSAYLVDKAGEQLLPGDEADTYVYAKDGNSYNAKTDGGPYYVFVGRNSSETQTQQDNHVFRVYHNPECTVSSDKEVSSNDVIVKNGENNKQEFYAKNVYLLTAKQREEIDVSGETINVPSDGIKMENFYLATLDPTGKESSDIVVTSPYRTQSAYLTQTVTFGLTEDQTLYDSRQIDGIINLKANTAQFTLKSGWGLLFAGMDSGTKYRLTEKIDDADITLGYHFKSVEHVQQQGNTTYNADNAIFVNTGNAYSVTGDTGNKEEAGHYVNDILTGTLTVEKQIRDDDKWEAEQGFTFTVTLTAADGKSLNADDLTVTKYTTSKDANIPETSEKLEGVVWNQTTEEGKTVLTAELALKHGQRFVITGIPMNTKYTVTETGREGYNLEYVFDQINGDRSNPKSFIHPTDFGINGTITGKQPQVSWLFVNAKPPVLPLTGNAGNGLFYLFGAAFIVCGTLFIHFCRKRRARVK